MTGKGWSGLLGIAVGGAWFGANVKHYDEQGLVALAAPFIIMVVGTIFLLAGTKKQE